MDTLHDMSALLAHIDQSRSASLQRLVELLKLPSISTQPAHAPDCRACAQHLAQMLSGIGFDASVRETGGHPVVVAHHLIPNAPHILFYGHYDVQPVDPLEEWRTPPFEPVINPTTITARGASDDKGQIMTFIEACRAFHDTGTPLPVSVSILIEGEEECGSPSLPAFVEHNAQELNADLLLVCDTGMWNETTPAITTALRGLMHEEVTLTCASRDVHSGMFGGPTPNPIHLLARLIASLHDTQGRILIPAFYDGVSETPQHLKQQWEHLGVTAQEFLGPLGLHQPAGEQDRGILEKIYARPTCDVNGILGGYTGEGTKTVIPSKASAKVSFRLVGEQEPETIRRTFRDWLRQQIPPDCTLEFTSHGGSKAMSVDLKAPALQQAARALEAEWGKPPVMLGCGGSIPIIGLFQEKLGMTPLMIGFALDDDQIHAPNEKYSLSSFHKGIRSWVRILSALG